MAFKDLSHLDTEFLLRWFEYRMTAETRLAIMKDLPSAYNRWMGQEIVAVKRVAAKPVRPHGWTEVRPCTVDDGCQHASCDKCGAEWVCGSGQVMPVHVCGKPDGE